MKAILEFNLPEDNEEFEITQNAFLYLSVLQAFELELRNSAKYDNQAWAKEAREVFYKILKDCEVEI